MKRIVWLRVVLAVVLTSVGVTSASSPAFADDVYTVYTCRGPDGQLAGSDGWMVVGAAVLRRTDCLSGGELAAGPVDVEYGAQQLFGWRFIAPPHTRIVAWSLYRTVQIGVGSNWSWNWNLFRDQDIFDNAYLVEKCYGFSTPCRGVGDGTISPASRVGESGVDVGAVIGNIDCLPAPCPARSPASMRIHKAEFTLRDVSDPVFVGVPSGDLLDTSRPVAGVRGVSFTATDRGGGVYEATVEVDGRPLVTRVVDDNGGRCRKPFLAAVPCRDLVSGSLSFDTAALPDGDHSVRLIVTDATGTNTTVHGPVRIRTQNGSPECDPAVRSSTTPVTVRFRGTRRRAVTRRYGRAVAVEGRIGGAGAGTVVYLLSREQRDGAPAEIAGTATTGPDGSFTLPVPTGPSRRVRAAQRVRPTDPLLVCSAALRVRVPARAQLRVSPRRVRPGQRMRLYGRLLGGRTPPRGKVVELQGRRDGRWRLFATARTRRGGRFRASYRFNALAARASYPIRARVRPDASYPFALGYSRSVRVWVR